MVRRSVRRPAEDGIGVHGNAREPAQLHRRVQRFGDPKVDLDPDAVDNAAVGTIFEELIRKFNEALNENPGEHFTPRDVVHPWSTCCSPATGGGCAMNGSPLFTGDAGSGESEIRRRILENDLLEALIALPEQLFYNTGIATYVWVLTNRKRPARRGRVQLVDATAFWVLLRKSLGPKRREIPFERKEDILRLLADFEDGATRKVERDGEERDAVVSRVYPTTHFGFRKITVERPLRLDFQASPERIARLDTSGPSPTSRCRARRVRPGGTRRRAGTSRPRYGRCWGACRSSSSSTGPSSTTISPAPPDISGRQGRERTAPPRSLRRGAVSGRRRRCAGGTS